MIMNGNLVEFIGGHIAEHFRIDHDGLVSYKESTDVKWGAIGEIQNNHNGVPETLLLKYYVKVIWNNGKLLDMFVGANEINLRKLGAKEQDGWWEFIKAEDEKAQKERDEKKKERD